MAEAEVNGIRLYYEEHGQGDPILCVHGTGSSALVWGDAIEELARLGRVIAYDRRGHSRSELPRPYERSSVTEHVEDAAALLRALDAAPAVVIGRSYGGAVAVGLALSDPERVRALVLLEPGEVEVAAGPTEWLRGLGDRMVEVAEQEGIDAVGRALISEALGDGAWNSLPKELRELFTANGPAIVAEQAGEFLHADATELRAIDQPTLLVGATDSPTVLAEVIEVIAGALSSARTKRVEGGHLINPAHPEVLAFIEEVLEADDAGTAD